MADVFIRFFSFLVVCEQNQFWNSLSAYPGFEPPLATFDFEDSPPQAAQPVGGVKRGRKGGKKR